MWFRYLFSLALALGMFLEFNQAEAKNSFLVAPGRIDFDLGRPQTKSFIITNTGDAPIRLSIKPIYFALDDKSLAAGEPLSESIEDDLRPHMRISPRVLSLRPSQRRDIRLSVRPKFKLDEGDYRAHLLVSMHEPATTVNSISEESNSNVGFNLQLKMETAVAVYAHQGERQAQLDIQCEAQAPDKLRFIVKNNTIWRFEGTLEAFDNARFTGPPVFEQPFQSQRQSRRVIKADFPINGNTLWLRWRDELNNDHIASDSCRLH